MYYQRARSTNAEARILISVENGNILKKVMVFLRHNKLWTSMMMYILSLVKAYILDKPANIWKNIQPSLPWLDNSAAGSWVMQTPAKVQQHQIKSYAQIVWCYALQWKTLPLSRQSMQNMLDNWSHLCDCLVEVIRFSPAKLLCVWNQKNWLSFKSVLATTTMKFKHVML